MKLTEFDTDSLKIYNFLTMLANVRISSKRQITIPVKIYNALGLKKGDSLSLELREKKLILQRDLDLIDELAGSIEVPDEYKGKSLEFIIQDAKKAYFAKRKKW